MAKVKLLPGTQNKDEVINVTVLMSTKITKTAYLNVVSGDPVKSRIDFLLPYKEKPFL